MQVAFDKLKSNSRSFGSAEVRFAQDDRLIDVLEINALTASPN
jgi:hypothetical protein